MFFEQLRMDHPGEEIPGPWITVDALGRTVMTLFQEEDPGEEERLDAGRRGERKKRHTDAAGRHAAMLSDVPVETLPGDPPSSPSGFLAVAESADTVNLHWCHDGMDLEGFIVQRRAAGGEFAIIDTLPGWAGDYIDEEGLLPGQWYEYRIGAYNEYGVSTYTTVAPVFCPVTGSGSRDEAPDAPRD